MLSFSEYFFVVAILSTLAWVVAWAIFDWDVGDEPWEVVKSTTMLQIVIVITFVVGSISMASGRQQLELERKYRAVESETVELRTSHTVPAHTHPIIIEEVNGEKLQRGCTKVIGEEFVRCD